MGIAPADRYKIVVAVHFVLRKEGKFLLGKRQNTGWSDGKFHIMGGHLEPNELALTTLRREAWEELGITFKPEDIKLVHVRNMTRPDHSRLHLYFEITNWEGQLQIKEPELCSELKWFDIDHLPENLTQDARETLTNINHGIIYYETAITE